MALCILCRRRSHTRGICEHHKSDEDVAARFHVHTEAVDKIKAAELLEEIKNTRWYNSTKENLTPEDVERIICDNPRLFTLGWRWFEAPNCVS